MTSPIPTPQIRSPAPAQSGTAPWFAPALLTFTLITFLAASSAPTPLYRLYQSNWGFSSVTLTLAFSVYAFSLIVALLTVGSLSDHVGRRPVIFASIALEAVSLALFIRADGVAWLIAARVIQGFATGTATSALGAALLDNLRARGAVVNSVSAILGMAVGALGSSILVQLAPAPMQLVYIVLLAVLALQGLGAYYLPETVSRKAGALASLRPRLHVPAHARRAMLLVMPISIALWALGGFYSSLGPTLAGAVSGLHTPIVGGVAVFTLTASGAVAVLGLRKRDATQVIRLGSIALTAGLAVTLLGVHAGQLGVFFAGTAMAGFGFGAGFQGGSRSVLPLAAPHERAGLLSAFYVMCYLAMSVPAIVAGAMIHALGLIPTMDCYGGALMVLSALSLLATFRIRPARNMPCTAAAMR
jgi:MFS family permease